MTPGGAATSEEETLEISRSPPSSSEPSAEDAESGRFPGYRLVRTLGQGGMGTVYEAEQDRPRRRVALKVIRAGSANPAQLRRFEIEAEVLARLQHPGIAQIYEVGTTEGEVGSQPYFAMELVDGHPLTLYAIEADLDTTARITLMIKICDAVHHAHQKGVIHRDLKPGNILVDTTGQPKVLDFGIARITDSDLKATLHTSMGEIIGTLPYMSPEQVRADPAELDTRSDIYSLGVVLYELLTGRLPQDLRNRPVVEAARMILEEDPVSLSEVDAELRGDPETIVAKALEKDKADRYPSVAELRGDLQRYLANQPIVAQPPTTLYQLRKFARRNRLLIAGVAATMVALIVGIIASSFFALRATREREIARVEARTAERVTDFMVGIFERAYPGDRSPDSISVREVLDLGARDARSELADKPAVRARVLRSIGKAYGELNLFEEALEYQTDAMQAFRSQPEADPLELARYLSGLANAHSNFDGDAEHVQESQRLTLEVIDLLEPLVEDGRRRSEAGHLLGAAYNGLGSIYAYENDRARLADAIPAYRQAIHYNELVHGRGHINVAWSYNNVGMAYLLGGDAAAAVPYFEEARAIAESVGGAGHYVVGTIEMNLAEAFLQTSDANRAAPLVAHAATVLETVLGEENMRVAGVRRFQGLVAFVQGDPGGAEAFLRESIRIATAVSSPTSFMNVSNHTYLGDMEQASGRPDEAQSSYETALRLAEVEPSPDEDLRRRLEEMGVQRFPFFE